MENSETPGNKPMPQDPKPGDDIQMHIETVTPDTEKVLPPENPDAGTKQESSREEVKEDVDTEADLETVVDKDDGKAESEDVADEKPLAETEEPTDDAKDEQPSKSDDPDDERNQVETVGQ